MTMIMWSSRKTLTGSFANLAFARTYLRRIRVGTKSSFIIPASGMNNEIRSRTTAPFKLWWKTSYSSLGPSSSPLERGKLIMIMILRLIRVTRNDQDEDDFDFFKELENMGNAFASDNQNAKELEYTSASIDPNILVAASDPIAIVTISEADCCVTRFLTQEMRTKLLQTPLANIHELDSELKELFACRSIGELVEHAQTFHASGPSERVESSLLSLEEQFLSLESRLDDAVLLKRKEEERIELQHAEITKIQQRCDELKEFKLLEHKESELSSSLATSKDSLDKHDATVTELIVSYSSIKKEIIAAKEVMTKAEED
ncbi:3-phosphoshikimate 1-carboxyvinyltransferase [Bienertia sinuspersici]